MSHSLNPLLETEKNSGAGGVKALNTQNYETEMFPKFCVELLVIQPTALTSKQEPDSEWAQVSSPCPHNNGATPHTLRSADVASTHGEQPDPFQGSHTAAAARSHFDLDIHQLRPTASLSFLPHASALPATSLCALVTHHSYSHRNGNPPRHH